MISITEKELGLDDIISDAQDFIFISKEITATQRIYYLESKKESDICPQCGQKAHKVKTRYSRRIKHGSLDGKEIVLVLKVHQFICENPDCSKKSFSENVPFTSKWQQRSNEFNNRIIVEIAQNGFRGTAKVLDKIGNRISVNSVRRLFSRIKLMESKFLPFVGVDDVASRRGHKYMSVFYNGFTHAPEALLEGRTVASISGFLQRHPEISLVARDRDCAYSKALSTYLDGCIQVADRFHLINNMSSLILIKLRKQLPKTLFFIEDKMVSEKEFKKRKPRQKIKEYDSGPRIEINQNFFLPPDRIIVGLEKELIPENQKRLNHQKTLPKAVKSSKSDTDYTTVKSTLTTENIKSFQRKDIFRYIVSNKSQRSKIIEEFWPVLVNYFPFLDEYLNFSTRFYKTIMGNDVNALDNLLIDFKDSSLNSLFVGISNDLEAVKNSIIFKQVSSGFVEGSNNKLKLIKRKGYGNFSIANLEKIFKLNYKLYHGCFQFELNPIARKEYFVYKTKRKNDQFAQNRLAA